MTEISGLAAAVRFALFDAKSQLERASETDLPDAAAEHIAAALLAISRADNAAKQALNQVS